MNSIEQYALVTRRREWLASAAENPFVGTCREELLTPATTVALAVQTIFDSTKTTVTPSLVSAIALAPAVLWTTGLDLWSASAYGALRPWRPTKPLSSGPMQG